jgi:hypothetical protein
VLILIEVFALMAFHIGYTTGLTQAFQLQMHTCSKCLPFLICRASQLRGVVAELRKVCAYPTLLSDFSMAGNSGDGNGGDGDSPTGSPRASPATATVAAADRDGDSKPVDLVTASGKLRVLQQLLPALQASGHRVLLLSQSRKVWPNLICWQTTDGWVVDGVSCCHVMQACRLGTVQWAGHNDLAFKIHVNAQFPGAGHD